MDGLRVTGMIDPETKADAYTDVLKHMQTLIAGLPDSERAILKDCVMHTLYGSQKTPKQMYGEDSPELHAFYQTLETLAPGACMLLGQLRNAWQPFCSDHRWTLPDGHTAVVPVMGKIEASIKVAELENRSFGFTYKTISPTKGGVSLIANVIHSIDAYVMRTLVRRCTHHGGDVEASQRALDILTYELQRRINAPEIDAEKLPLEKSGKDAEFFRHLQNYASFEFADSGIAVHVTSENVKHMKTAHIKKLGLVLEDMCNHPSFPVVCIHDEFKCSPNDMNWLRHHYRSVLAELTEARVVEQCIQDITGRFMPKRKLYKNLTSTIRSSNYGLA